MTNTIVTKKVNPVQQGVGTSSAQLCAPGFDIAAKAAAMLAGNSRSAAQAAQERFEAAVIVHKTTPLAEPKPLPPLPQCTLQLCETLRQAVNSPEGRELLHSINRNREVYLAVLAILLSKANELGGWKFNATTRDLGVMLSKSHKQAGKNLHKLDGVGLIHYRHSATQSEVGDAPPMSVDLSPIVRELLDVTGSEAHISANTNADMSLNTPNNKPNIYSWNVYGRYAADGEFADATMRANPVMRGLHGRTLRNLNASALNGLDLVARGELVVTRRMLVEELGMSPGSAAGATRVWVDLGLVEVHKNGRTNEYVFGPDWQRQLDALVPRMVSFLASYRLKISNVSDRIMEIDRRIRQLGGDPGTISEGDSLEVTALHTRRKKAIFARKCLVEDMEAKDLVNRPAVAAHVQPGQWVGTPRQTPKARNLDKPGRTTEGDRINRRIAIFEEARSQMGVAA